MNPAMLLSGAAGSGKTHLLCDLAKERLTQKLPTVFLLGQNFCEEEPWGQIIRQLQLNCQTKEELLGILDAAGQAARTRTLILIDAINESACKEMWKNHLAGILEAVKRYPWVGIVLSIRSTYFKYMIPQQLIEKRKLIAVPHKGFAGIEYKATREFFRYYNIKQPDVPLLNPEFQNPLFLKLFCCGLNNVGITEVPRGSQNITKVYENFIESVNDKLADENVLNYDLRDKIVWKAVEGLAGKMAERNDNRIPLAEAKDIVYKILPSNGYHNSLFHHLETEGIITESIIYTKDICEEAVQFSYERFADHLIAKYLLDKHLNVDAPQSSFKKGQPLASLFTQEFYWHYEGLIEAISIQLPERIDKELIELVPKYAKRNSIQQAFLDSLIWRDLKSISKKTKDIINKYIIQNNYDQLMETFITIATLIDHPFNADALHQYLLKQDLPNRDATWSIFLFYQAGENGAIDRLIDWAWSSGDKSHIDDSSILLAAKTLTWFLTTSQRYLRDRATKAMVNLLTERIELLPILIEDFKNADDPYIHERLYAVAYGCAMRTNDKDKIRDLADYIYENVFKDGTPPVHVLLRDYARGVIELALYYGLKTNACLKKIRPPYKSTWPDDIP
ncbi:MAG: ATP-binding protein, partial [Planctomycetes bacterium]|nr:ATP-binding protein [Planctomycetota bacterium]